MKKTVVVAALFSLAAMLTAAPAFAQPAGPPSGPPPAGAAPKAATKAVVVEEEPEIVWQGFGYSCVKAPEGAPYLLVCTRDGKPAQAAPAGGPPGAPPGPPPPGGLPPR